MKDLFGEVLADAAFSKDRKHRYWLYRIWDESLPLIMFIGLNPSTANETEPDNTIKRVTSIAKHNGYGGFYMCNLFTYISTDPEKLNIEQGNDEHSDLALRCVRAFCEHVCFAWGNFKTFGRDKEIEAMFNKAVALKINQNGSPKHPLYCRVDSEFVNFK
jgi:hypothetical protein